DRLEARVRTEGAQDVADVVANRLSTQVEHGRDLVGRGAFAEQLQDLVLAGREPRSPGRTIARLTWNHDAENRVAVVAVFDRHRADLGLSPASVGGEHIALVIGHRYAPQLPLELLPNDSDVLGRDDLGERSSCQFTEDPPGCVVEPADRPVACGDEARNLDVPKRAG